MTVIVIKIEFNLTNLTRSTRSDNRINPQPIRIDPDVMDIIPLELRIRRRKPSRVAEKEREKKRGSKGYPKHSVGSCRPTSKWPTGGRNKANRRWVQQDERARKLPVCAAAAAAAAAGTLNVAV